MTALYLGKGCFHWVTWAQHQDLEGAETIYDALLEVEKTSDPDGGPHPQPGTGK